MVAVCILIKCPCTVHPHAASQASVLSVGGIHGAAIFSSYSLTACQGTQPCGVFSRVPSSQELGAVVSHPGFGVHGRTDKVGTRNIMIACADVIFVPTMRVGVCSCNPFFWVCSPTSGAPSTGAPRKTSNFSFQVLSASADEADGDPSPLPGNATLGAWAGTDKKLSMLSPSIVVQLASRIPHGLCCAAIWECHPSEYNLTKRPERTSLDSHTGQPQVLGICPRIYSIQPKNVTCELAFLCDQCWRFQRRARAAAGRPSTSTWCVLAPFFCLFLSS